MLFAGGLRYDLSLLSELEITKIIQEHSADILGDDSLLIVLKSKDVKSRSFKYIPRAYIISLKENTWCIFVISLSTDRPAQCLAPELNRFYKEFRNVDNKQELVNAMLGALKVSKRKKKLTNALLDHLDFEKYLSELVSNQPQIIIATDELGEHLNYACKGLAVEPSVLKVRAFSSGKKVVCIVEPFSPQEFLWNIRRNSKGNMPRRGEITPVSNYERPILEALIELGGKGRVREVMSKVHEKMEHSLKDKDYEKLLDGSPRWEKLVQWARYNLKSRGLLSQDSPMGTWKLSAAGQEYCENAKRTGN